MIEKRVNNCLLIHVHKDIVDELNLKEIAVEFVSVNDEMRKHWQLLIFIWFTSLFLSTLMHLLHLKKLMAYVSGIELGQEIQLRMHQNASQSILFFKTFSGGACPQTPLEEGVHSLLNSPPISYPSECIVVVKLTWQLPLGLPYMISR